MWFEKEYKQVLLGTSNVGKMMLLLRTMGGHLPKPVVSLDADPMKCKAKSKKNQVKLEIWVS
jgi:GTPase SAR1 family protein